MQSTTRKNILLAALLVILCFMIKCKMDSDGHDVSHGVAEVSTGQEAKDDVAAPVQSNVDSVSSSIASDTSQAKTSRSPHNQGASESSRSGGGDETGIDLEKVEKIAKVNDAKPSSESKPPAKQRRPSKPKVKRAAKIEFEEQLWDFGEITEGDIVERDFVFTNTGNKPLQIIGADASCGCARPIVPFLDVAPGESNKIGVTYNSVGKHGDQYPEIIIESNTSPRHHVLKLKGTVREKEKATKKDTTGLPKDTLSGKS